MIERFLLTATVLILTSMPGTTRAQAQSQNPPRFERFLVPVSVGYISGGYGSIWETELRYRNNSDKPLEVTPLRITDQVPTIGRTELLSVEFRPISNPGVFLRVNRDGSEKVQFDLRLINRADTTGDWGTKIPVVREEQFLDSIDLINVPTSTDFRSALRVYALDGTAGDGASVTVQIYSHLEVLLASTDLPLNGSPKYADILSLADAFPEIRQVDRVRVHIEPHDSGTKLWAFVTAVSNHTQHVAVVTPE